jgi:ketosteroid isomerase-like protein
MEKGLTEAQAAFAAALVRSDAAEAAALYAVGARLLTPSSELLGGRLEIEAFWQAGLAVGLTDVELTTLELHLYDEIALEYGRYVLAAPEGTDRGKYVVLHRREADGVWRRAVDLFNPDPLEARPAVHTSFEPPNTRGGHDES